MLRDIWCLSLEHFRNSRLFSGKILDYLKIESKVFVEDDYIYYVYYLDKLNIVFLYFQVKTNYFPNPIIYIMFYQSLFLFQIV